MPSHNTRPVVRSSLQSGSNETGSTIPVGESIQRSSVFFRFFAHMLRFFPEVSQSEADRGLSLGCAFSHFAAAFCWSTAFKC